MVMVVRARVRGSRRVGAASVVGRRLDGEEGRRKKAGDRYRNITSEKKKKMNQGLGDSTWVRSFVGPVRCGVAGDTSCVPGAYNKSKRQQRTIRVRSRSREISESESEEEI
jgi:hypothetical protein